MSASASGVPEPLMGVLTDGSDEGARLENMAWQNNRRGSLEQSRAGGRGAKYVVLGQRGRVRKF